jgi:4-amino-4-deoxy-L-arabinose transferase-like glycosyltransferase
VSGVPRAAPLLVSLAVLLAAGTLLGRHLLHDPRAAILLPEGGAEWIQLKVVPAPQSQPTRRRNTHFRTSVEISELPAEALLAIRALRSYVLLVNGEKVATGSEEGAPWIEADHIDVASHLRLGRNALQVIVTNTKGPPALLLHSTVLGVASGPGWKARTKQGRWIRASPLHERAPFEIAGQYPTSTESLRAKLPQLAGLFALGLGASLLLQGRSPPRLRGRSLEAAQLRWLLLGAWIVLCANNLLRIPLIVGFDFLQHYKYVAFIAEQGRLPLASDGPQMFQPPLFYLVATPPYLLFSKLLSGETAWMALRVVPMLAGLSLIEICYRASRLAFPERRDLQIAGSVVGGLLPINLYMSQSVGNEPFAGCTAALVVLMAFRILRDPASPHPARRALALGVLFGAALLSKVTVALLLPPLLLALLYAARAGSQRVRSATLQLGCFALASGLVAGWYFLRNWIELGVPYVGAWDPSLVVGPERDLGWQYPGHRIPEDLLHFGTSLVRPIYASLWGFWDGFYSTLWLDGFLSGVVMKIAAPPWNYGFMLPMALLSLPLGVALALGVARTLTPPYDAVRVFAAGSLAIYVAAMLYLFMRVPTYSNVKASYTLGLAPCYLVLIASGLGVVMRGRLSRALVAGYLCVWAGFGYWAYFV